MRTAHLIAHGNSFVASDDDDFHLFFRTGMAQDEECILRIKHDDPQTTHVNLQLYGLDSSALKRLGIILRDNTNLESLCLVGNQRHMAAEFWPCVGIQTNRSIKELTLYFISLGGTAKLKALAPFLTDNRRLQRLSIRHSFLGQADINFLSDQLMCRAANTLEELDFSSNFMGNVNLDKLVMALIKNWSVKRLNLATNGIGRSCAASLVALLESKASSLEELDLSNNHIDTKGASELIGALTKNNKLKTLNLKNNHQVQDEGWEMIFAHVLQLVCDGSSISNAMSSNHTLSSLADPFDPSDRELAEDLRGAYPHACAIDIRGGIVKAPGPRRSFFNQCLGVDRADLLRASFALNYRTGSDLPKARRKIVQLHVRGDLNLGEDATIHTGVMPRVLALIGFSWDATYRILRARPGLCCESRLARELRIVRSENQELRFEIERLRLALNSYEQS